MKLIKKLQKKYYKMLGSMIGDLKESSNQTGDFEEIARSCEQPETEWQKIHLEILERIFKICGDNNIPVFLSGETALCAIRDKRLCDFPEICIDEQHFETFVHLIDEESELEIPGLTGSKDNPSSQLIVDNPRTLDFDLDRGDKLRCIGLHVKVFAMQRSSKKDRIKIKTKTIFKKYIKSTAFKFGDVKRNGRKMSALQRGIKAVLPDNYLIGQLRDVLRDGRNDKPVRVLINGIDYPRDIFDRQKTAVISDKKFFVPERDEEYLCCAFGQEWRLRKVRTFNEKDTAFRDSKHSAEEYKKYTDYLDYNEYSLNKMNLYRCVYGDKAARIIQNRYKWLIKRTHERFMLWHKYMPEKKMICMLYDKGDFQRLTQIMSEYIQRLKEYADRELTICFDKKLFEIAMDVMRHEGSEGLAEKIKKMVPEEHRKEVVIKDYEGNIIEHSS